MGKLKSVKLIASVLISLGLISCGGAQSTDTTNADTEKNSPSSQSHSYQQLNGRWLSSCISSNLNSSEIVMLSFSTDKEAHRYHEASAVYDTPNCTGTPTVIAFSGSVKYQGEFVTSICTAEKTKIKLNSMIVGGKKFTGEVAQNFLDDVKITNPSHDIACQYRDQLFIGQVTKSKNSSSQQTRPTTLNVMVAFDQISGSKQNEKKTEKQTLEIFYSDFIKQLN